MNATNFTTFFRQLTCSSTYSMRREFCARHKKVIMIILLIMLASSSNNVGLSAFRDFCFQQFSSLFKMSLQKTKFGTVLKLMRSYSTEVSSSSPDIKTMIRVNLAGETGADKIYAGQLSVLGNSVCGPKIKEMWEQERVHKAKFEELINKYRVRPSALTPLWNVAGFCLGAGTALLGPKAAMACTVAVESVIVEHYNEQLRELMADSNADKELLETIKKFRDDEQEHHDTGIEYGAEEAIFYDALSNIIKLGSKCAISVAKVV